TQQFFNLGHILGLEDIAAKSREGGRFVMKGAVEHAIGQFDRKRVQLPDEENEERSDCDPSPTGQIEEPFDTADLLMDEKYRHAQKEAEGGDTPERDRDIDDARTTHRFENEPRQYPISEEEKIDQILRD